jgi:ATP-binding cassette, subfamily C (CFTR/MRP), member 1
VVLDDVLSAVDARTEKCLVDRLFGKAGLLRKMNLTIILATHAGEHNQILECKLMYADQELFIVRHLSLADNVIVIGTDGCIAEQGAFEVLRSQDGFVSKLLLHPELLESKPHADAGGNNDIESKTKPSSSAPKPLRGGATANDVTDLTRRIGDLSVYKYYLKSIGWKFVLANTAACVVSTIAQLFPRKCFPIQLNKNILIFQLSG